MLEWIISSTALTLIVILLRAVLKGKMSLRLQYALWALVLVRLLVPLSFGSTELSVQNVIDRPAVEAPQTAYPAESRTPISANNNESPAYNPQDPYAEDQNVGQSLPVTVPQTQPAQSTATIPPAEIAAEAPAAAEPLTVNEILNIVWASGAGLVALWLLLTNLQFYCKLRRSRKPLEVEHAPLPVFVTDKIDTPCLFGLIRPKIYVTPEVAEDETALRYSIEHEATHRRHGDHLWSLLRGACLAVHWYNPLVWVAAILSRSDAELACDEATIKRIGEEHRAEYGRTLIQLTCEKRPAILVAATTMTGSGRGIKERIKLIVKKPKTAVITLIAIVLVIAIAVGCTFTGAKTDDPTEAAETTAPSERAKLEASELPALLDTIDLQRATLTYYYGTEITFPAEATENAEQYFGELKQLAWQDCNMGGFDADDFNGNYVRLTAPHTTVTIYQKGLSQQNLLHVETDNAEGWFQTGSLVIHEDGSQWYPYDNALAWYIEAQGASLYGGNTRILTAEELDYFRELTASTYETYDEETGATSMHMTEISCFFTSYYTNVRDIDAYSFLWYFPYASYGESIDEAEWQLVQRVLDWRMGKDQHLATREELMVPIHRIPRASVNEVLMKYAGVTVEEMNTDWFTEAIYVPETDCFYTYTSDAGHGTFVPWFGIEHGNQVSLWSRPSLPWRLDLKKDGDGWRIISHTTEGYDTEHTAQQLLAGNNLPAGRAKLNVSDIPAILDAIDLREAMLTYHAEADAKEITYPAAAAIYAERYLEKLKLIPWQECKVSRSKSADERWGYFQLTVPHIAVTFYRYDSIIHIETDNAEAWLYYPSIQAAADSYETFDYFYFEFLRGWLLDSCAATLYGANGRLLTAEELDYFTDFTNAYTIEESRDSDDIKAFTIRNLEIGCFLTSTYSDVRDLEAQAFLECLSAVDSGSEDGDTFEIEKDGRTQFAHCVSRARANEVLMKYAGVTVEEMHTNWFEEVTYDPDTDCFYPLVNIWDTRPWDFHPSVGVEDGDVVTLWMGPSWAYVISLGRNDLDSFTPAYRMTLQKNGDEWRIVSYVEESAAH
ncbi:MAG: M56 family metallopeptidase [Oscillospiraceae bacterium]|nr:M56 family metallopeptidase [Oscillospiraceae bacterium]